MRLHPFVKPLSVVTGGVEVPGRLLCVRVVAGVGGSQLVDRGS